MTKGLFGRLQQELEAREKMVGLSIMDIRTLSDPSSELLKSMMRAQDFGLHDVTDYLQQDEDSARAVLADLVEKGFVREIDVRGEMRYRVRFRSRRKRELPPNLWVVLKAKIEKEPEG